MRKEDFKKIEYEILSYIEINKKEYNKEFKEKVEEILDIIEENNLEEL